MKHNDTETVVQSPVEQSDGKKTYIKPEMTEHEPLDVTTANHYYYYYL